MNKKERIRAMKHLLRKENGASIRELSDKFSVSEMTIRRDLSFLEENNIIKVIHGAAIYNNINLLDDSNKYDLFDETDRNSTEKYEIGKKAAELIDKDDSIILDIGTTIPQIIRHIPERKNVTAICSTMNSLLEIQKKGISKLIMIGGYYRKDTQMFDSDEGVDLIKKLRANIAFISAAGIDKELGITCVNNYETAYKKAAIESASEVVLVADSSKFGLVKPSYFAELSDINIIVTDKNISKEWSKYLKENSVRLILA